MNTNNKYCSFTLAKKLNNLGIKYKSLYEYRAVDIEEDGLTWWEIYSVNSKWNKRQNEIRKFCNKNPIPTFTYDELKEIFPKNVDVNRNIVEFGIEKEDDDISAMAKVLIYLIKNKFITLK